MASYRIAVISVGTRGDVQPLIMLGRRLQALGHTVRALVSYNAVPYVTGCGIEASCVNVDLVYIMEKAGGFTFDMGRDTTEMGKVSGGWYEEHPDAVTAPLEVLREFKPDMVVWTTGHETISRYEIEAGVPLVEARCFGLNSGVRIGVDIGVPERPTFMAMSPQFDYARVVKVEGAGFEEVNGLYMRRAAIGDMFLHLGDLELMIGFAPDVPCWWLGHPGKFNFAATYGSKAEGNKVEGKTLPPETGWYVADDGRGVLPAPTVKDMGNLSEENLNPSYSKMIRCGPWLPFGDPRPDELIEVDLKVPRESVEAFLSAGPGKPVAIGWGSMKPETMSSAAMLILALRALRICRRRAVIVGGWAKLQEVLDQKQEGEEGKALEELAEFAKENCMILASAPNHWLFPQCSCVVQHGGAGTLQVALHGGTPVVVTPIAWDQPHWAQMITRKGIGVGFERDLSTITPEELADAIVKAEGLAAPTREFGERLRKEGGVAQALGVLQDFLEKRVAPGHWRREWLERWQGLCEEAHTRQARRLLHPEEHFKRLKSEGGVDQSWLVINPENSSYYVQHNYADGSYKVYALDTPMLMDSGRWTIQNGKYSQEGKFAMAGKLYGTAASYWMKLLSGTGPQGKHDFHARPDVWVEGFRVAMAPRGEGRVVQHANPFLLHVDSEAEKYTATYTYWAVVARSSMTVRSGKDLKSDELEEKLSPGAEVLELELSGNRLRYGRLTGSGPDTGWISISVGGKALLQRVGDGQK